MKKYTLTCLMVFGLLVVSLAAGKRQLNIRITETATSVFDETTVYLDLGSMQYIYPEDGQKVFDTSSAAPNLYSFSSDSVACFVNSFGSLRPGTTIPLGLKVSGNGNYVFSATLIDNFDPTSTIILEDKYLGIFKDLRIETYSVFIDQPVQDNNRFTLHISAPPVVSTQMSGCNNNDGSVLLNPDTSIHWTSVALYDETYSPVQSYLNVNTNLSFNGLPFGNYSLVFKLGSYTAMKPVYLPGRSIAVQASASTLHTSVGQQVQFFSVATNTTGYMWDFGEGSVITGIVNPTFSFGQAGTFTTTVYCTNSYGCTGSASLTIVVEDALATNSLAAESFSCSVQNKILQMNLTGQLTANYHLQLFNAIGQQMLYYPLTTATSSTDVSHLPSGVYIVRVTNGKTTFTKKVVVQ